METNQKEKNAKNCKKLRNSLFFILASAATAAIVYITIQEGHRIKEENELLKYEVW